MTVTLILRLQGGTGVKGTVESPGEAAQVFRDAEELVGIVAALVVSSDQDGKGRGSTSSSAMRETYDE